jgi:hypothetical protein
MAPDSNQQSNTSSTRVNGGLPGVADGMVRASTWWRWRSVTPVAPVRASNSATDPMTTTSLPSADVHTGSGVPQKRDRDTAQSRADSSQLWKLEEEGRWEVRCARARVRAPRPILRLSPLTAFP